MQRMVAVYKEFFVEACGAWSRCLVSEAKVTVDWARLSFVLARERQVRGERFLIERLYGELTDAYSSVKTVRSQVPKPKLPSLWTNDYHVVFAIRLVRDQGESWTYSLGCHVPIDALHGAIWTPPLNANMCLELCNLAPARPECIQFDVIAIHKHTLRAVKLYDSFGLVQSESRRRMRFVTNETTFVLDANFSRELLNLGVAPPKVCASLALGKCDSRLKLTFWREYAFNRFRRLDDRTVSVSIAALAWGIRSPAIRSVFDCDIPGPTIDASDKDVDDHRSIRDSFFRIAQKFEPPKLTADDSDDGDDALRRCVMELDDGWESIFWMPELDNDD